MFRRLRSAVRFVPIILICAGGLFALSALQPGADASGLENGGAAREQLARAYGALPLSFQPNRGQADQRVRFLSSGAGYGLFLTRHRVLLALEHPGREASERRRSSRAPAVLSMGLLGARPDPRISAAGRLAGRVNYLPGGDREGWATGIPTFSTVHYSGVWPGIGMSFYGNRHRLEYDFDLAPGVGTGAIGLRFTGQRQVRLDPSGDLLLDVGGRTVRQLRPYAYQVSDGERRPVASHYVLVGGGRVSVRVGAHDPHRALTIDPQLVYSSYLGGAFKYGDSANAIAVDRAGDAYVTGSSYYSNFPVTPAAFQTKSHHVGPWDTEAFVTEFDPSGSDLVYSTYLGNGNESTGNGIAVDQAGNAYIAGYTTSGDFPTTPGAFKTSGSGTFVTKLNPSGSGLVYSTLLSGDRDAYAIAVDSTGDAYVTGGSASGGVPTTPGAFQTTGRGAFVTKLNPTGSDLVYSTYLGAVKYSAGNGIAVDQAGDAYVAGSASETGFPTTPGAFLASGTGAFVTKLRPDGSGLLYSTLLDSKSGARAVAVDPAGNAYVAGTAPKGFPTTPGALQASGPGAFVTKLNPTGSDLVYSTYLGGKRTSPSGIAVDPSGNVYVGGTSGATNFPTTTGALQRAAAGYPHTLFVTKLNPSGSSLLYSTYLGGGSDDSGLGLAIDSAGHVYVTGRTSSTDFPTTPGAFQGKNHTNEGYAAFVAKLDPSGPPVPGISLGVAKRERHRVVLRGRLDPAAKGSLSGAARWRGHEVALSVRRRKGQLTLKTARLRGRGLLKLTVDFQGSQPWESESLHRKVRVSGRASGSR